MGQRGRTGVGEERGCTGRKIPSKGKSRHRRTVAGNDGEKGIADAASSARVIFILTWHGSPNLTQIFMAIELHNMIQ